METMRLGIAELFVNTNDSESEIGEVAERLNASVSKTEIPVRVSGVQIPPSPLVIKVWNSNTHFKQMGALLLQK